jgi:hypothetical protein
MVALLTRLRYLIGLTILLLARAALWAGMMTSRVGWWLMDREDAIAAQKEVTRVITEEFKRRGA